MQPVLIPRAWALDMLAEGILDIEKEWSTCLVQQNMLVFVKTHINNINI